MKKKSLYTIISFFLIINTAFANVKLPEFSFIGKEIGSISVKPSFADITIKFKTESAINIYLEKLKLEQKRGWINRL